MNYKTTCVMDEHQLLSTEEIKNVAKGILTYIKKVCEENNIVFFLAYGTALGAVRHKGFIPWDDDIDIIMTREEFKKFKDVISSDSNSRYKLLYLDSPSYNMPLPKVVDTRTEWIQTAQKSPIPLGVYVDVFILDNVPIEEKKRKIFFLELTILQKLWIASQYHPYKSNVIKKFTYKLISAFAGIIGPRKLSILLDKCAQKYSQKDSEYYGVLTFSVYGREKDMLSKEILGKGIKVSFEGEGYLIPELYDKYLSRLYGEYMILPPKDKQVSHHSHIAYWK